MSDQLSGGSQCLFFVTCYLLADPTVAPPYLDTPTCRLARAEQVTFGALHR